MRRSFAFWFIVAFVAALGTLIGAALLAPDFMNRHVPPVLIIVCLVAATLIGIVGVAIEIVMRVRAGKPISRSGHFIRIVVFFVVSHFSGGLSAAAIWLWNADWTAEAELLGSGFGRGEDGQFHPFPRINGQYVDFVVDVRRADAVMSRADAANIGIDLGSLTFDQQVDVAGRTHRAALVHLPPLHVLRRIIEGVDVLVPVDDGPRSVLGTAFLDAAGEWQVANGKLIIAWYENLPFDG